MIKRILFPVVLFAALLSIPQQFFAQSFYSDSAYIAANYTKIERKIAMRDGKKLFTSIYIPSGSNEKFPILMTRTPYGCDPYGEKNLRKYGLGPNKMLMREKYIFVYQDVRGRYKSEGDFQEMTPAIDLKKTNQDIDESSDTYDTVEWLLKNIDNNNGKVGLWGISYPGFYALAALPDAHPAIKAVSPQAPVTDEFAGDDCNHNGAFFLMDNFNFYNYFDGRRNSDGDDYEMVYGGRYRDAYSFFLKMGGIANSMKAEYFGKNAKIWNQVVENDTYNAFWKARNILPHLKNIKPAVMIVGGWFDCQDLYGPLQAYEAIKKQSPATKSYLVMGPWSHGAWAAAEWSRFGTYDFGDNLNAYYQEIIETPFFNFYLKEKGELLVQEANIFEVGSNKWHTYDSWPLSNAAKLKLYFDVDNQMNVEKPKNLTGFDEYLSDPNKPVPYIGGISGRTNSQYMIEDQRFASQRPDVLTFSTEILQKDLTLSGPILANLFISTTGTDADFVVKIIDELPDSTSNLRSNLSFVQMGGFQRLVRAEVMRGKFRKSLEKPEPFEPGTITKVNVRLNDVAHVFKKGHRLVVQVQSSWFPLVDRNPQKFMKIANAKKADFKKSTIRLFRDAKHSSSMEFTILNN